MGYEPSWDAGDWAEFWDETPHDANEFESTPPFCKHSAIRVAVLTGHASFGEPVWAWKCRLCGAPMFEVPEVAE